MSTETRAPLLTVTDVAERLRLGRSTVYRLVADGDLDAVQIGRAVRFEPAAVDFFISRKRTRRKTSLKAIHEVGG